MAEHQKIDTLHQSKDSDISSSMIMTVAHTINQIEACRNEMRTEVETLRGLLVQLRERATGKVYCDNCLKIVQQIERIHRILAIPINQLPTQA